MSTRKSTLTKEQLDNQIDVLKGLLNPSDAELRAIGCPVPAEKPEWVFEGMIDKDHVERQQRWAVGLTVERIKNMPEEELLSMVIKRPGERHKGAHGFLLNLKGFKSPEHLARTMYELIRRLGEVEGLEEKIQKREKEEKELEDQIDIVDAQFNLSEEEKRYLRSDNS